jgi:KDO2-lipid IV(A) lauroyltransferase
MPSSRQTEPTDTQRRGLGQFWHPRYWSVWMFWLWLKFTASIPLSWALAIHERVGALLYAVSARQRAIVRRNLQLCFPHLSDAELERLTKRHFAELGAAFAECAVAWLTPDERLRKRFDVLGLEHLNRALERGKGVILYTGHFTGLEICGRPVKWVTPLFVAMFSHRSNALLEEIQRRGRMRCAHEIAPSNRIRATLDALARNAVIWYAPDQAHQGKNAALIPFFGEPAMTNTATSKLARVSGAAVVPFSYGRVPGEARFRIEFHPPLEDFPSEDAIADTGRLVSRLEDFIRACPEQYLWAHKKFKGRPGLPDPYSRAAP